MFEINQLLFRYSKDYFIKEDNFNYFDNNSINVIKYLCDNLKLKIEVYRSYQEYAFIVSFKSILINNELTISQRISIDLLEYSNIHKLYIIISLLNSLDQSIIINKKFGIFPIKELPFKFYNK
jgi:hypothetical protein